ncbi:hypothetical protein AVEN_158642-1 [Araneus ventricosus]|uniref:Uncharacterized protein n=1 Tax=Araneus ventricosus TaxID=182803 RepID=A0A4Y2MVR3_ARAVE|nr:hypothetical protein AVEN_158642-1 [Araneus ventricosus]
MMISLFCFLCSQISTFVEGLRCFHCDNDDDRRVALAESFHPLVSEPGSVIPAYYVPAADLGAQTFDEDFMLLQPSREASTQTTGKDFNFLKEIFECHTHENGMKKYCFSQGKTLQDFNQDSAANQNLLSANRVQTKIFIICLMTNATLQPSNLC